MAATNGRTREVNLVGWDNGGGLRTDVNILSAVLTRAGCRVRFNGRPSRPPRNRVGRTLDTVGMLVRHAAAELRSAAPYDVNLFVETIDPRFIPFARTNCLIPNPEWFRDENRAYMGKMDWVLCKTRSAVDAFREIAAHTRYVGFASVDRRDEVASSGELVFLHTAGASPWKGTAAVIEVWRRHPEWPRLRVLRSSALYGGERAEDFEGAANIELVNERLDDATFRRYQNTCQVHVCPSEAEGFGHIIGEAMSCGAVVITTDGAPMNELVTPERGVLVRAHRSEPMRLATRYFVDPDDLERQVARVIAMTPEERRRLGDNARRWFEEQRGSFERALSDFVNDAT
jgi:glycosyltransferase involved in cell wall biosynthesis